MARSTGGNHFFYFLQRKAFGHVGVNQTRRHTVDGDAALRQLQRQGFGGADDAGLSRTVIHLAAVAHEAGDRSQRNDSSRLAGSNHGHDNRLQNIIKTVQIGMDHAVPIFPG